MINIDDITVNNLKNNVLEKNLPEFYDLKNVFENNGWHHETTFEHVLIVLEQYEKILKQNDFEFLDRVVVDNKKKDLIKIAILLHDISKNDTYQLNEEGTTTFPDHEKEGGKKARKVLEKFYLDDKEKDYISFLVSNHGQPHIILGDRKNCDGKLEQLKAELADSYKETILLAMADTMGSRLKDNNQEDYNFRINKYKSNLGI